MDKVSLQRKFIMFNKEDEGFDQDSAANGYVKLEIKEKKGKLYSLVQNLKLKSTNSCSLFMVCTKTKPYTCVKIGDYRLVNGKSELKWDFNPVDVANTGCRIDEYEVFAVLLDYDQEKASGVVAPLAGYVKNKIGWRNSLVQEPFEKSAEVSVPTKEEKRVNTYDAEPEQEIPQHTEKYTPDPDIPQHTEKYTPDPDIPALCEVGEAPIKRDESEEVNQEERIGINEDYLISSDSLQKLKETLAKHFRECEPFEKKRSGYRWWRVNNPVYLNNVFYLNNIRTPIFFNSVVIMSHFKYRHLIMGIYKDKRNREFIACGVPSVYGVDERPFGTMCRWMPVKGEKPNFGDFGYWVVYINPLSGRFLSI